MRNLLASFLRMPRDIWLYFVVWGFLSFAYFGIFAVLFNLYLLRLDYGPEQIGLLTGAGQLMWGLAAIPAGIVGVRIGNRAAVIWGLAILAAAVVLLLVGHMLPTSIMHGWIATWWIISWVGSSLIVVNGAPYMMAICEVNERRMAFTLQQVVTGVCGFAGSVVAGSLPIYFANLIDLGVDSSSSYWYALWLAPLFYLAAMAAMMQTKALPPIVPDVQESTSDKLPLLIILFVGLVVFLQTSGEGTIRAFFNVYLDAGLAVPLTRIATIMGLGQVLPILSSLAAMWILHRIGTAQTLILTGVVSAFFMLILAYFGNWLAASTGYIGILLTMSFSAIARSLFSQEIVLPQWRTYMSSVYTIGLAFGWAIAAGAGGYIITSFGYRTLFAIGAILALTSALFLGGYLRGGVRGKAGEPKRVPSAP